MTNKWKFGIQDAELEDGSIGHLVTFLDPKEPGKTSKRISGGIWRTMDEALKQAKKGPYK